MNVLILSVGTRNKIVQYFKETICGKVIATDMSELAPAIYEADKFYKVPRITEEGYIGSIISEGEFGRWCESKNADDFVKCSYEICSAKLF